MKTFTSTVLITSTLSWPRISSDPSNIPAREPEIGSAPLDALAGDVGGGMSTLVATAPDSSVAGVPGESPSLVAPGEEPPQVPGSSPTVASTGTSINPSTSTPAVVPSFVPSENLVPPAVPPALRTTITPPTASVSGPAITSLETHTTNASVTSITPSLRSSTSTQSPFSNAQASHDDGISIPIGLFAFLMVLAAILGVVFLGLATLTWRRKRKREANTNLNQGGNASSIAVFENGTTQRDDELATAMKARSNEAMKVGDGTQPGEQNNVRLSVFPGWPKWLVQHAKGNGARRRHVDFEMVTGGQGGR